MSDIKVRLLKSYKHPNKSKPWAVGTVLQLTPQFASDLIHSKHAELYRGEYPPKDKVKTEFFKPKK